jgi:hypothetical protein
MTQSGHRRTCDRNLLHPLSMYSFQTIRYRLLRLGAGMRAVCTEMNMPKSNAAIIRAFCIGRAVDRLTTDTVTPLRICHVGAALALAMLSIVATKNGAVGEPVTDRQCRDEGSACSDACSRFVEPGSVLVCQRDCDNKKDACIMGVNNPYRAAEPVTPTRRINPAIPGAGMLETSPRPSPQTPAETGAPGQR